MAWFLVGVYLIILLLVLVLVELGETCIILLMVTQRSEVRCYCFVSIKRKLIMQTLFHSFNLLKVACCVIRLSFLRAMRAKSFTPFSYIYQNRASFFIFRYLCLKLLLIHKRLDNYLFNSFFFHFFHFHSFILKFIFSVNHNTIASNILSLFL